ncbi:hypothetical protein [Streptomyces sp. NPDC048295]|uniref:hypothetical protein n=1 Tax=Streptomyces sp. NPDC048295 TaxID=3154617 RepID=UPI003448E928
MPGVSISAPRVVLGLPLALVVVWGPAPIPVVVSTNMHGDVVGRMLRSSDTTSAELVNAVEVTGKSPDAAGQFNEPVW